MLKKLMILSLLFLSQQIMSSDNSFTRPLYDGAEPDFYMFLPGYESSIVMLSDRRVAVNSNFQQVASTSNTTITCPDDHKKIDQEQARMIQVAAPQINYYQNDQSGQTVSTNIAIAVKNNRSQKRGRDWEDTLHDVQHTSGGFIHDGDSYQGMEID